MSFVGGTGVQIRTLHVLGWCFTTELYAQSKILIFKSQPISISKSPKLIFCNVYENTNKERTPMSLFPSCRVVTYIGKPGSETGYCRNNWLSPSFNLLYLKLS